MLGGTSLLGGRGNLVATAVAALFLTQLDQFVLALGVTFAVRTLVQAAALAVGVALYTIDWRALMTTPPGAVARRASHPPDRRLTRRNRRQDEQVTDNGRENTHDPTTRWSASRAGAPLAVRC